MHFLKRAIATLGNLVFPPHCCACALPVESGSWCDDCRLALPHIKEPRCQQCSLPSEGAITGDFSCPNCHDHEFHFRCNVSAVMSRGAIRDLIHGLKYNRKSWNVTPLVQIVRTVFDDKRIAGKPAVLVPVPLHSLRLRERSYNQAELLARALGRVSGFPVVNMLRRTRATTTQTHFDRARRLKNLRGAFALKTGVTVPDDHNIILVDDVFTTGATLDECARTLVREGFPTPDTITIARA